MNNTPIQRRRIASIHRRLMALALLLVLAPNPVTPARAAGIIYVSRAGISPEDGTPIGTSWTNAYPDLQAAIRQASAGQSIWVAKGTYTPTRCLSSCTFEDQRESFMLKSGVAIYGGFAGNETRLNQRDIAANPTILSGDLLGNDGANFANNSENSLHVVIARAVDSNAILDGFTIMGGRAGNTTRIVDDKHGGGIFNHYSGPTLTNLTFSGNSADLGGGLSNVWGSPVLTNVSFSGNQASLGGGMYNINGNPTLTNVSFSGNQASLGGGMINVNSRLTIRNSIFWGNLPDEISNDQTSSAVVSYSIVKGVETDAGSSNLNRDPLFVTPVPPAPSTGGDLRLRDGSPAIRATDRFVCPATDRDGKPRHGLAGACDMGAYENDSDHTMIDLEISPTPSLEGQAVRLRAQLSVRASGGYLPRGDVQFYRQGAAIASAVALDAQGVAELTVNNLPPGTQVISAAYSGHFDGSFHFYPSTSAGISHTVQARGPQAAILVAAGSPQSALVGTTFATALQALVVDAFGNPIPGVRVVFAALGGAAGGTFSDGSTVTTTTTDSQGLATAPAFRASDQPGNSSVTATASGVAVPAGFSLTNLAAPTTTNLSSSPNPALPDQTITFTATVAASTDTPGGSVTFFNGSTALGDPVELDARGQATFSTASLTVGAHAITAVYAGQLPFTSSSAAPLVQFVTPPAALSTTTRLSATPNPARIGQAVTLRASVTAASGNPSGSIEFFDGDTRLGSARLDADGQATLSTSDLATGIHALVALYAGEGRYAGSMATLAQRIDDPARSPTTLQLRSSLSPANVALSTTIPVTLTARVQSAGIPVNTGSVTFFHNDTPLATTHTFEPNGDAHAVVPLAAGAYVLTAVYSANAIFAESSSFPLVQIVNRIGAATTSSALEIAPNPARLDQTITLIATVTGSKGRPGGSMAFFNGATLLGSASLVDSPAANTSLAVLKLPASTLGAGAFVLRAVYTGSIGFGGSQSGPQVQLVSMPGAGSTTTHLDPLPLYGEFLSYRITVLPEPTATHEPGTTPTGVVLLLNRDGELGRLELDANGQASWSAPAGENITGIKAVYTGNTVFKASVAKHTADNSTIWLPLAIH